MEGLDKTMQCCLAKIWARLIFLCCSATQSLTQQVTVLAGQVHASTQHWSIFHFLMWTNTSTVYLTIIMTKRSFLLWLSHGYLKQQFNDRTDRTVLYWSHVSANLLWRLSAFRWLKCCGSIHWTVFCLFLKMELHHLHSLITDSTSVSTWEKMEKRKSPTFVGKFIV